MQHLLSEHLTGKKDHNFRLWILINLEIWYRLNFEGESVDEIQTAFRESVDDYLAFCAKRKESPEKPFSGKFVLRLPAELHRKAYIQAKLADKSLNSWVTEVLQSVLKK